MGADSFPAPTALACFVMSALYFLKELGSLPSLNAPAATSVPTRMGAALYPAHTRYGVLHFLAPKLTTRVAGPHNW